MSTKQGPRKAHTYRAARRNAMRGKGWQGNPTAPGRPRIDAHQAGADKAFARKKSGAVEMTVWTVKEEHQ